MFEIFPLLLLACSLWKAVIGLISQTTIVSFWSVRVASTFGDGFALNDVSAHRSRQGRATLMWPAKPLDVLDSRWPHLAYAVGNRVAVSESRHTSP